MGGGMDCVEVIHPIHPWLKGNLNHKSPIP